MAKSKMMATHMCYRYRQDQSQTDRGIVMSNRSMPYSIEAEESLLGNIMLYPDAMRQCVDAGVTADDFYLDKHRQIYNLMHSMYENKEKVDTVSLSSRLKDFGVYDKIGGLE